VSRPEEDPTMRNIFDNPLLLIVLLLIIVLVFGAKRLPDAARSVGKSMRIFKSEVKEMKDDDTSGKRTTDAPSEPIEGRVVDRDTQGRTEKEPREGRKDL
jgi:sec-independent protein translocase protein TatA